MYSFTCTFYLSIPVLHVVLSVLFFAQQISKVSLLRMNLTGAEPNINKLSPVVQQVSCFFSYSSMAERARIYRSSDLYGAENLKFQPSIKSEESQEVQI